MNFEIFQRGAGKEYKKAKVTKNKTKIPEVPRRQVTWFVYYLMGPTDNEEVGGLTTKHIYGGRVQNA